MNTKKTDSLFEVFRTMVAILIAMLIAFTFIFIITKQPLDAIQSFLFGPFSSIRRFGSIIELCIPLIFTGLAVCIMFQAKQFSMIAEGAFFGGGIAAAFVAIKLSLPFGLLSIAAILFAAIIGGLCGALPGIIKAKWNTDEFVVSLMFNYVIMYLGMYLLKYFIRDENAGFIASLPFKPEAILPIMVPNTRIHFGLILAVIMIIIIYLLLYRTKWGYSIRMIGHNKNFAKYSGISTASVIIMAQVLGGSIAAFGGAVEMLGRNQRFSWSTLPGYGWDGIMIAILARENPLYVPIAALFLSYLRTGADILSRSSDISSEFIAIIQAIMILLIAARGFLSKLKHKIVVSRQKENAIIAQSEEK